MRGGGSDLTYELTQDCGTWVSSGSGSFEAGALGTITFIDDPVEPGVVWLRHRFFAGRREARASSPTPSPEPTATPSSTPESPPLPAPPVYLPWISRQ